MSGYTQDLYPDEGLNSPEFSFLIPLLGISILVYGTNTICVHTHPYIRADHSVCACATTMMNGPEHCLCKIAYYYCIEMDLWTVLGIRHSLVNK